MRFPTIYEIATTDVVTIDVEQSVNQAIDLMKQHNLRDIIVNNKNNYHIITAADLIRIRLSNQSLQQKLSETKLYIAPQIHMDANIIDALEYMDNDVEYICLVDDDRKIRGIVSNTDIVSSIDPEIMMENYRIREFFNRGIRVSTAEPIDSIESVLNLLSRKGSDCVIVLEKNKPVGILTTRDAVDIVTRNIDFTDPCELYMTKPVETIPDHSTIKEALNFIKNRHFKRVVVVDDRHHLLGIITQKELISQTYTKWAMIMKNYQKELKEINALLERKTERLSRLASTDPLTGLMNRGAFEEIGKKEMEIGKSSDLPLSMLVLDIDHFKLINDSHGHLFGDRVLKELAETFIHNVRSSDVIGRWGGEEFVILLPGVGLKPAEKIANKLRKHVESHKIPPLESFTISIGISQMTDEDTLETLFIRADKALYSSKQNGRNRVSVEQKEA